MLLRVLFVRTKRESNFMVKTRAPFEFECTAFFFLRVLKPFLVYYAQRTPCFNNYSLARRKLNNTYTRTHNREYGMYAGNCFAVACACVASHPVSCFWATARYTIGSVSGSELTERRFLRCTPIRTGTGCKSRGGIWYKLK